MEILKYKYLTTVQYLSTAHLRYLYFSISVFLFGLTDLVPSQPPVVTKIMMDQFRKDYECYFKT